MKYFVAPPNGQQFSHPIIEARPNYHLPTNNVSPQRMQLAQNTNLIPQQQIIQGVSRNKSKVFPSQS